MKKLLLNLGYFIIVFLGSSTFVKATHLMGGSLTYEYLGLNSGTGLYDYRVKITIYRYCAAGSTLLPTSLDIGVYEDDPNNPTGDKQLVISSILPLFTQQLITPPNANDSCTFAPNVCVEEGVYQAVLSVPSNNTSGYYFVSDRCCRNDNIANLFDPGNTGQTYFAFAPDPTVVNNSPTFATAPVPFICNTDTATILNQAYDADGDLLIYNFVVPYSGISNGGNPTPNPPPVYNWPIATVTYAPTYGLTNPFGPGGFASLDTTTGLASYYAPNQGFYVLAVEIKEYRNGVLIGITRRDLQIIVITCPVNPAPILSTGIQTTFNINEGQTLCFTNSFTDSNGDSIFISHTGDIFNSIITNPPATFTDGSGAGTASGSFCWTTTCDQGRPTPYQFSVVATDNGCPAKITNVVYTINVTNTPAPTFLNGPDTLCLNNASGVVYNVNNVIGSTHNWVVTNGSINGAQNGTSINVTFTTPGTASVSAVTVNPFGCASDTITKLVEIIPQPTAVAGPDVNFCSGGSATLGTGSTAGYSYSWSPATNLSSTTVSNPTVTVTNTGSTPISTTYVLTTTLSGCTNTDTVVVTTNPNPAAVAGPDIALCSGNTANIGGPGVSGVTYVWTPATGLSNPGISDPTVTLTNTVPGVPDTIQYILQAQNAFGCSGQDTVTVIVNPAPVANAGPNKTICSGTNVVIGAPTTGGYTYSWNPTTGLSNTAISNPTLTLINNGTVNDTILYIVTTTIGQCTDQDTVRIIVKPLPISVAGNNLLLCGINSGQIGGPSTGGYTYVWSPSFGLDDSLISNPTVTVTPGPTPDTLTYIVTTTLNGCITSDTVLVISGPAAIANAGPNKIVCSDHSFGIGAPTTSGYTYSWSPTTGLSNSTISNPVLTLNNPGTVNDTIFYIVTANLGPCSDQDTVRVIIKPLPLSNAGSNLLLCGTASGQIGGATTSGYTYVWTPSAGLNDTLISNPTVTVNNPGTTPDTLIYIVTTTLVGCVTTDTVEVISGPNAVADAGTDVSFCSGDSASIGSIAISGYTYSWSPATGLSNNTDSNPMLSLTNTSGVNDTLNYIVTSELFGCNGQDTVQVIVRPNPVAQAGPDIVICGGDSVTIGTTATAGYTYLWTPAANLNNTGISNPTATISNNGTGSTTVTYTVNTTLNGCSSSDSVTITVNPQPNVTAAATPASICIGGSAALTGSGATTYSWALLSSPGTPIGTGSPFTVSPNVTTTYLVTGTNGVACSNQDTVTVVVNPLPAVQINSVSNTVCAGDSLTLNGTGATTYTWSILGGATIGTGSSIQVSPSTNTTYVLNGTDGNSCSNSDTISITVNPAATISSINGTLSVCPGVTGVQYWVNNPNPNSTYNWTITNGVVVTGQGGDTITVDWSSTSGTGIVSVVEVTDLGCQSDPINLPVSINVILTPIAPTGPTTFCANTAQGITYTTINTPGSTYTWTAQGGTVVSGNGTNTVTVDWTAPGPQTVYLWYNESSTTTTNVCFGTSDTLAITINPAPNTSAISGPVSICVNDSGSFSVTNTPGSSYVWSITGGNILSGNNTNAITADWTGSGSATISVQETNSYGCIGSVVSIPVTVNALPAANAGSDVGVCIGQGVQLNASGGVTYSWTPPAGLNNTTINNPIASPSVNTTYVVLVTDANGCKNTDSVNVTLNALPVVTVIPNSSICIGGSIQLNAGGGTGYQWSPATTLDNPGIATPNANPTSTTTYTVVVTNNDGCVDSANVTITVNPLPVAVAGSDTIICAGTGATLFASGGVSYNWTPASGLNNSTVSNPVASPTSNTTYTVTVTDVNGCQDDAQVTISVNDQPVAAFEVDPNFISASCSGAEANLINNSTNALTYNWIFPNGTTSSDVNPTYLFTINGDNLITLVAINNMCTDTATANFNAATVDNIIDKLPNVFTPNGDGSNDCFDLGKQFNFNDCSDWRVYDRWGKEVFHSTPGSRCWNGKKNNNGEESPAGTYFLTMVINGKKYSSAITLIR